MSKVVAIWGNDGSGRTTFSAALAQGLSKYFRSVLLANADAMQPSYNLWGIVPDEHQAAKENRIIESLGQILRCPNLTDEYVRRRLQYHPDNHHISLMGYLPKDDYEAYSEILGNDAETFLHVARKLFQVTLVDCTMPQSERVTERALQSADIVVILLEPNCLGISFLRAQASFIRKNLSDDRKYVFLASKVEPRSAVSEFESMLGVKFDKDIVPFTQRARDNLHALNLFSEYDGEYGAVVDHVAQLIKEDESDWSVK